MSQDAGEVLKLVNRRVTVFPAMLRIRSDVAHLKGPRSERKEECSMHRKGFRGRVVLLLCAVGVGASVVSTTEPDAFGFADESVSELAQYFGFGPLELFKMQQRSGNMLVGDLNHDGLNDLVLVDNSNSRIDILQQRSKPDSAATTKSTKINAIANDWRFEHRKMSVDKAIASLTLGDFNGD